MESEEMSGYFLSDGQELTIEEVREARERKKIEQADHWLTRGESSLEWLHSTLGLPKDFDLKGMIRKVEIEGSAIFYNEPRIIQKSGGGCRIIISPKPELMLLQKRINRLLKKTFKRPSNIFGYRGGSCLEVAERHAAWPSTLKFDVKDAFFQISWAELQRELKKSSRWKKKQVGFSGIVARWLAKLCTYSPPHKLVLKKFDVQSFLPQGAPTSAICFDLACRSLDEKLGRIAERVSGIVSRFADNYYFSMKTSRISRKLEHMIICDAQHKRYGDFRVHKIRQASQGQLCRMLGYNIMDSKITNTRDFNRTLRGALHVLKTKLERGLPYEKDYARVRGYMGFSINISPRLQQTYKYCQKMIVQQRKPP